MPPQHLVGYQVVRVLGSGNRADVLLAHDQALAPVALKVFRAGTTPDDIDRELFALDTHSCPHLLSLDDVATTMDGHCIAVLPRLSGPLLSTLMRERGASWQLGELLTILVPVVAAVAAAHHAGFAHGGITARAIMFTDAGAPVLVGLGHTVRCGSELGEAGIMARAARRSDYVRIGDLLTQLFAQLAAGEDFESEAFEGWYAQQLNRTPFEPFAAELERALFELAVPIPVNIDASSVRTPPGISRVAAQPFSPVHRPSPMWAVTSALALLPEELTALAGGLIATVAERLRAIRRRLPSRNPLLVAGGIATLLLTALLLWPQGTDQGGLAESTAAAESGDSSKKPETGAETLLDVDGARAVVDTATAMAATSDDPVVAFAALIAMRADCLSRLDADCLAAVLQPGSGLLAADEVQIRSALASGGTVTPVPLSVTDAAVSEHSGDAAIIGYLAVVGGTAESEPASALMIRTEAGWRLRELFEPSWPTRESD